MIEQKIGLYLCPGALNHTNISCSDTICLPSIPFFFTWDYNPCFDRVTKGFCAKNRCTHRTYSYYCPTVCFGNREEWTKEPEKYRISDEKLKQVDELLSVYHGTKCYHNFTSGKQKGQFFVQKIKWLFIVLQWIWIEHKVKKVVQTFIIPSKLILELELISTNYQKIKKNF